MPNVRIAAVSDIHVGKAGQGTIAPLVAQVAEHADVLLLGGDLTDYGTAEEARILVKELGPVRLPVLAVLGNHDWESGHPEEVTAILRDAGVTVLDGESIEVLGIGFAGTKGFAGGFGRGTLGAWGEPAVKAFVQEAVNETMKLESALARLRTRQKVALLHYSPHVSTVVGEPAEIFPFLGCGRHEEPLLRYKVSAVFHGHAHRGTFEGHLENGTPCWNVALPLMRKISPDRPFHVITLDTDGDGLAPGANGVYEGPERRKVGV